MAFTHLPPRYVYDDRFTAVWTSYVGSDFAAYDIYYRPSDTDVATWVPSGSTDRVVSITNQLLNYHEITGLPKQTEYDVCVCVRKTDDSYEYASRIVNSAEWTQVTGDVTFTGGARHVNTVDTDEAALYMDGDKFGGPYNFSDFKGIIHAGRVTTTQGLGLTGLSRLPSGLFAEMGPTGYGLGIEHGTGAWSWNGQYPLLADRSPWNGEGGTDGRIYIMSKVSQSTNGITWGMANF